MNGVNSSNNLNSEVRKHKGQKEVVLSRPAAPLRRHYPANVLDALSKTANANEMSQSNQVNIFLFKCQF